MKQRPSLYLGVVAIEKGAFGSPSTKVANFTLCKNGLGDTGQKMLKPLSRRRRLGGGDTGKTPREDWHRQKSRTHRTTMFTIYLLSNTLLPLYLYFRGSVINRRAQIYFVFAKPTETFYVWILRHHSQLSNPNRIFDNNQNSTSNSLKKQK